MGRRPRTYHVIFALTLVALIALGMWWTVYIVQSVEFEHQARMSRLRNLVDTAALIAGHSPNPPRLGRVSEAAPIEWVYTADCAADDVSAAALPLYPHLSVRASTEAVREVQHKNLRRRVMIVGEGTLLFVLLGVCTVMLYRLVRNEQQANKRMQDFVSSVTHEMKTPLAGIKSLLQTMAAGRVPEADSARLIAMGLKETDRLEHSIENVLLSGSLRTDRFHIRLEPVELRQLLDAIVAHRLATVVDRPNVLVLKWEIPADAQPMTTDPRALRVILENLIDNALKYGGSEAPITLRTRREGELILISIEDQGIGFDEAAVEEMFAPFVGGERGGRVQHGTGLGLTIARTLARRMRGDITAASAGLDQGSVFTVTLPRGEEEVAP